MKAMENKKKAIEKSYGEHWESVKDYVDENGWFNSHQIFYFGSKEEKVILDIVCGLETEKSLDFQCIRPKSLQGIETNNGWIKIESEDDLPSEKIKVWFCAFGEEKIGTFHPLLKEFRAVNNFYNYGSVTHYQPIIKPKPPIY